MISVTGGEFRGKKLAVPSGDTVRPTLNKARQAIFNVLDHMVNLNEMAGLDLYAGSGALGIEALSRGVSHMTFVEKNGPVFQTLKKNVGSLALKKQSFTLAKNQAHFWLSQWKQEASPLLILLDPPYYEEEYELILPQLAEHSAVGAGSIFAVESPTTLSYASPDNLELLKSKRYGQVQVSFFIKN